MGQSPNGEWDDGLWLGVELDEQSLIYGHGYRNELRFFGCEDEPAKTDHKDEADAEAEEAQEKNEVHVVCGES